MLEERELEALLRQLRPRRPRPLGRLPVRPPARWLALAATILAVLAATAIRRGRVPRPPQQVASVEPARPTMGELGVALRAGTLEGVLDRMEGGILPDPAESGGALSVLGDVGRDFEQDASGRGPR